MITKQAVTDSTSIHRINDFSNFQVHEVTDDDADLMIDRISRTSSIRGPARKPAGSEAQPRSRSVPAAPSPHPEVLPPLAYRRASWPSANGQGPRSKFKMIFTFQVDPSSTHQSETKGKMNSSTPRSTRCPRTRPESLHTRRGRS